MIIGENINQIVDWLNGNQGILAFVLFILTFLLAWVSGLTKWLWKRLFDHKKLGKVICAWGIPTQHVESIDSFEYSFTPVIQNKSELIIRDFWVNLSTSGFDLRVEHTNQSVLFGGWNIRNEAMNLTLNSDYRFSPQNFLEPFKVVVKLKKQLPVHGAWMYISYGAPGIRMVEIKADISYRRLQKFIKGTDHSGETFLKLFGFGKKGVFRAIWP